MAPQLRCVTFEIANTLVRLASPTHALYRKPIVDALRHYRLPVPSDAVMRSAYRAASDHMSAEWPHYGGPGGIDERTWWKELVIHLLEHAGCEEALRGGTFHLVFQRAYSSFGSHCAWLAPDGAREALAHVKKRGLVVGTVCNTYHRYVDNNLPGLDLHHDLDFAVVSNEVGDAKPAPHMFEVARKRATDASWLLFDGAKDAGEVSAPAMLHVGTSLANDYLAAKQVGMRALLLDASGQVVHDQLAGSDVIRSLRELPAKLDEMVDR